MLGLLGFGHQAKVIHEELEGAMTHVDLSGIILKTVLILEDGSQARRRLLCHAKDRVGDASPDGIRAGLHINVGGSVKDKSTQTGSW